MQQVGTRAMSAGAVLVEPRRPLVEPRRPGNRFAISARHLWVLHQRRLRQLVLLAALGSVAATAYVGRELIVTGALTLYDLAQDSFAANGFAVDRIEITGQTLTSEADILSALEIDPKTSTIDFDADAARQRIEQLPAIASATVRKIYPGQVIVKVVERVPVARWRVDGVTFVVDGEGVQIGEDAGDYGELPLVIGDGAADNALATIRILDQYPELKKGLVALSRIADRRWDMIYDNGVRVQLPEMGVAQALVRLRQFQRDYQLLDRDITLVDLRVADIISVEPTQRQPDPTTETSKKKT